MALPLTYHWRNLFVRKSTTLLTVLVVASVVGVFAWMLGFASALSGSLSVAGDNHKVMVINRGATSETNSALAIEDYNKLTQLTGLERDPGTDDPLISPEMMVQVSLPRLSDGGKTFANIAVRGVTEVAFKVHRNVKLIGNPFSVGTPEVIVGLTAAKQFGGLELGDDLELGYGENRRYKIVGYFSAGGGPTESEIWGRLPSLMNAYNRTMYSSASLLLQADVNPKEVIAQIGGPAIQLAGETERDYWQRQAELIGVYLRIAYLLVGMMSVAAVLSIANTMFALVSGRTREIAMLRTIGFSDRQILVGFIIEAVLLAFMGGILGCIACVAWLRIAGNTKDMFGARTFTVMAFEINMTPWIVAACLLSVALVALLGAFVPARRAARIAVVSALREP